MDEQLISLADWAKEKGISRAWAITLAGQGRLPGARIVDNYRWMLPANTPSPTRKLSERVRAAAIRRAERAQKSEEYHANQMLNRFAIDDDYL